MVNDQQTIRFQCPQCAAKMRAPTVECGEKRKCPKCKTTFRVPTRQPSGGKAKERPKARPAKKQETLVPVVCGVCSTRIYARLDQIGTRVKCPDCYTQNTVKKPAKEVATGPDLSKVSGYDLAPQQELHVARELGESIMDKAEVAAEQEVAEAPKLPTRPFVEGVFSYPFRLQVLPILIILSVAWTSHLSAIHYIWNMEGMTSAFAPIFLAIAAAVGLVIWIPSLLVFQKIMESAVEGEADGVLRPEGGFLALIDWLVDSSPVIIAAVVSYVPCLLIGQAIVLSQSIPASSVPPIVVQAVVGCGAYFLCPVFVLSILENNSIVGLYSHYVWGSLKTRFMMWCKTWCMTMLLLGLGSLSLFGYWKWNGNQLEGTFATRVALAFSFAVCHCLYFRILGRLAFALTHQVSQTQVSKAKTAKDQVKLSSA